MFGDTVEFYYFVLQANKHSQAVVLTLILLKQQTMRNSGNIFFLEPRLWSAWPGSMFGHGTQSHMFTETKAVNNRISCIVLSNLASQQCYQSGTIATLVTGISWLGEPRKSLTLPFQSFLECLGCKVESNRLRVWKSVLTVAGVFARISGIGYYMVCTWLRDGHCCALNNDDCGCRFVMIGMWTSQYNPGHGISVIFPFDGDMIATHTFSDKRKVPLH